MIAKAVDAGFYESVRLAALERTDDFSAIVKAAATDSSPRVLHAAADRCPEAVLAQLVMKLDSEAAQIDAALPSVRSDAQLTRAFTSARDFKSGRATDIVSRMSGDALLEKIAASVSDGNLRHAAIQRIQDGKVLERAAAAMPATGRWEWVLDEIEKRPEAEAHFAYLSKHAKDGSVKKEAARRYKMFSNDPNVLMQLAYEARDIHLLDRVEDCGASLLSSGDEKWESSLLYLCGEKLPDSALTAYALDEKRAAGLRGAAAKILLQRDYAKHIDTLAPALPQLINQSDELLYELARHGDKRAVPRLFELSIKERSHGMTGPNALGRIHCAEAAEALLAIMEQKYSPAEYACEALKNMYRDTKDGALKQTIAAFPQRLYFVHEDIGDQGRSCHGDEPDVHFDLGQA